MLKRLFALVLLAVGFSTAARADYIPATWTDNLNVGSGVYIGNGQSYTYTHDVSDDGFRPLTDWITGFHLSINLQDDSRSWLDGPELAFVNLPGALGDSFVSNFGLSGEEFGGWSILGLLELNTLGTLTVTISSIIGDFNLVGSTLTASGVAHVASVPEPGALGLLGIGLMGMALSMRRRKIV
jgi:hypothetical protein